MAGYISQETIDAILDTSDIVSLVSDYTKLEHKGANDFWGCCPFHGEKTASFHVDGDKKFYHCFGCNKGGNIINFIMEMENISYVDALTTLAKKSGIQIKYQNGYKPDEDHKRRDEIDKTIDLYERTASMFHYFLLETDSGKKALEYLTKRGLTMETIKKFRLGYSPADPKWLKRFLKGKNYGEDFLRKSGLFSENYPDYAFFSNRLMFPIFNRNGQVVAFGGRVLPPADESTRKYVNSSEMPQFKKRETLYGFNFAKKAIRENRKVIFCEGNMDVIAYHQCGIDYAVATLGTAFTQEVLKMMKGFVISGAVYLSFDGDNAGQNATMKAIQMCRSNGFSVKIIRLQGGKDPAEIMLKYGADNLTAQVNNAILDSDYLLLRLGEKYPVDTPEGKTKAALEYFQYVDSLQTDMQRESCLEQLCQTFNLKPEAVKRDFKNRDQARERANIRQNNNQTQQGTQIKLDAELRGLIAVTADLDQFKVLRSKLNEDDFQNPTAKRLYKLLEVCFNDQAFTIRDILARCDDEQLIRFITESISSGIYQSEKVSAIVEDTINYIIKNTLYDQKEKLLQRIRNYTIVTEEDQKQFNELLVQSRELDKRVHALRQK